MQLRSDYSLQSIQPILLRAVLYLNGAQKSEELLIYNPEKQINWKDFYNLIDSSDVSTLENIVNNIN